MKKILFTIIAIMLLSSFSLFAVDFDPDARTERFERIMYIGGGIGLSQEDDDYLLNLMILGDFKFTSIGTGFVLPIRFVLADDHNDTPTVIAIPKSDWDHFRDYMRIPTYFSYGHKLDEYYLYFGEFHNKYIGHGTILGAYYNNLRYAYAKRGINAHYYSDWAGVEVFADDIYPPSIVGGRAFIKPWSFINKEAYLNNLEIGFSYFADLFAPEKITPSGVTYPRKVDTATDSIIGLDAEMKVVSLSFYSLTPYIDYNFMRFAGMGLHLGMKNSFDIPIGTDFRIENKFEFRQYQSNYTPAYFDSFYDIKKEYFDFTNDGYTKYGYFKWSEISGKDWQQGYYGDIVFDFVNFISFGGSLEYNGLYNNNMNKSKGIYKVNLFANLKIKEMLRVSLMFTRDDAANGPFFRMGGDSLFFAAASFRINRIMSIGASVSKQWILTTSTDPNTAITTDYYKSITQLGIGFNAGFNF